MDKDRVKGKAKDITGRIERQAGEWTGDSEMQAEGAVKQAEGKVQNAAGKVKDKVRDLSDKAKSKAHDEERDEEVARDEAAGTPAMKQGRRRTDNAA